jgi:hypothetical protein
MNIRDIRRYEMLVRLNEFGVAHADLFPPGSGGGQMFATLKSTVDQLQSQAVAQAASKSAVDKGTASKDVARETLRNALLAVTRTAPAVAAATAGLAEKFRMPRSRSDQRLVVAARAIVQDATPLRDLFVAHHLPPTFLEDLTAAIDAFEGAIQEHADATESRASAGAEIGKALAASVVLVKRMDPVVVNRLSDDAGLLAEWRSAHHLSSVSVPYPKRQAKAGGKEQVTQPTGKVA